MQELLGHAVLYLPAERKDGNDANFETAIDRDWSVT